MKRAKKHWDMGGRVFLWGVLALVLIAGIGSCVPRPPVVEPEQTPTSDLAYPHQPPDSVYFYPFPPKNPDYPAPEETSPVSTPTSENTPTEIPWSTLVTITPVPITPFPTLTLRPGPSPTLIPLIVPAPDSAGTIFSVAQESEDGKASLHAVTVDPAGNKLGQPVEVLTDEVPPEGYAFPSPDGSFLGMAASWGWLNIFSTDKDNFSKISLGLGSGSHFLNWFPDSRHILYADDYGPLVLRDPFSEEYSLLVVPGYGGITGAAASPDGQFVVYAYSSDAIYDPGLWVVNSNGQNAHLLVSEIAPLNIAWSPDGKRIAFFGYGWQVIDADGSNLREIAPGVTLPLCYFLPPLWSPDSQNLAVVTSDTGASFCEGWTENIFDGTDIVLIDVDSGTSRPLLSDGSTGNIDPTWSPDGSQLAFVSNRSGTPEVWVVNADGSNLRQLTEGKYLTRFPVWVKPDH